MEAIAQEAQLAKATAYAAFPNKQAVFVAVVEDVITALHRAADEAAATAPTPLRAIEEAVLAKFLQLHALVHTSPESAELLAASNQLSAEVVQRGHQAWIDSLTERLVQAGLGDRRSARPLAEVIDGAAEGVIARASSADEAHRRMQLLLSRLLRP